MKSGLLLSILLLASCTAAPVPSAEPEKKDWVTEFPQASSVNWVDFDPIRTAVGNKSIVMMGGSIDLASEFSLVRDVLIRNLHENSSFNLLLFEGSPVEFWIAEEEYLTSRKDVLSGSDFQKAALLTLWQTEEIRSVVDYALRSQTGVGSSDLYLSSFGVQMGQGRRFVRSEQGVFETLVALLKKRDKRLSRADEQAILFLDGLVVCKQKGFPDSDEQYLQAEEGIRTLSRVVARSTKNDSSDLHEKVLALLPKMAGYSLEFCREAKDNSRYNQVRDVWASKQFADLFSTLNEKTLVWAHSAHIRQAAGKEGQMSFGAHARSAFPDEVFAIHFTAGSGRAVALTDAKGKEIEPIETALLGLDKVSLEEKLSGLSAMDFFVVSKNFPARFKSEETTRREPTGFMSIDPRADFDAYYFVREITPPQMR